MKTLGLRHVALNVADPQLSKRFYCDVLNMQLEWEPDPENVYLTSQSQDNLALHKSTHAIHKEGSLDHIGFFVKTLEEMDEWYQDVQTKLKQYPNAKILRELKTHRDGARSFYFCDPDGITIQLLFHPPVSLNC